MNQQVPVFVVSLARAAERRNSIGQHLNRLGVDFRFTDAVDGRLLSPEQVHQLVAPGATMHPGAIGCYLSHLAIYELMIDEKLAVACVLEDDARLDSRVVGLLRAGCDTSGFDYCFLDSDDHNDRGPVFYDADAGFRLSSHFTAYPLSAGPHTTHAYLITLEAARLRIEHGYPLRRPIDRYDHLPYRIRFAAMVKPKGAWVSEHSLESFTSAKSGSGRDLSFKWLRRWPTFYLLRDLLRMRNWKRAKLVRELVRSGALPAGRRWRSLPSGREILFI